MLVSAVIDRILLQLAEDTSTPNYLTRAQILTLVNDCVSELTESLHCFTKRGHIWCEANKPKYTLPTDLEQLQWVRFDSKPLEPSSIRLWSEADSKWSTKRGTPHEYALDPEKQHVIWLHDCPNTNGDRFIMDSTSGVPYAIIDPWTIDFDGATQDFTTGETATGGTSLASAEIIHVEQDGLTGTLYFESDPGSFTDNEPITDSGGGSAVVNGTGTTGGTDTWTFSRSYGLVEDIKVIGDGGSFWDLVDSDGEEVTNGVIEEIWSPNGNLIFKYSYYPEDLVETDHLLKPYRESDHMFLNYVMHWALRIEAEGQDLQNSLLYAGQFERQTGINLTKRHTPQRAFAQAEYRADDSGRTTSPRYPDNWPPVDRNRS